MFFIGAVLVLCKFLYDKKPLRKVVIKIWVYSNNPNLKIRDIGKYET